MNPCRISIQSDWFRSADKEETDGDDGVQGKGCEYIIWNQWLGEDE